MTPWEILGIEPTPDERAIKRAYALKLKLTRPEEDKEGFLQLREAYERALEQRYWLREEAEADETPEPESELEPEPAIEPELRRARRTIDAPPILPDADKPALPRKDFRRGWRTASRRSEEELILRIEADLDDPALVHLEARAAYERDLLIWLLKHTVVWPRAFQMAQKTLQWREKESWPEWPWTSLERYHRRCRLRAFFADPERHRSDFPALADWLAKMPGPESPRNGRPFASVVLERDALKQKLAQFRADYEDVLQYEPEGQARLDAFERVLKRFPTVKAIGYFFNLLLGIGLLVVSWQNDWVILVLASIVPIVISVIVFMALANDFLDIDCS